METSIHWRGNITVSKAADEIVAVTDTEIEFVAGIWQQKQILIEALETWLKNNEATCEDLKCSCQ